MAPKRTCLVVDDCPDNCFILNHFLTKEFHYEVAEAFSAEAAFLLLKERTFDVMFLDWKMPKVNGIDFFLDLKERKAKGEFAALPITILCTAINERGSLEYAVKGGVNGFLLKPFDEEDLKRCLDEFVNPVLDLYEQGASGI
jgi:two-component system chemotaxis response regulator CheY